MIEKQLANGGVGYYWNPPLRDTRAGFKIGREAVGSDYSAAVDRANFLNNYLLAWRKDRNVVPDLDLSARFGTVDWWIERFMQTNAYKDLSDRSKQDYREALNRLADLNTDLTDARTGKRGRVGELPVASLSPAAVDKLYEMLRSGGAIRQANYPIDVARRAWRVVARTYPSEFLIPNPSNPRDRIALNPFVGLERAQSDGTTLPATREQAYALSEALAGLGHPALGAVPIICLELLQRPENVLAGYLSWTDYRPPKRPLEIRIDHKKTKRSIWQPLEDEEGQLLYPKLEAYLKRVPRLGVPIVLFEPLRGPKNPDTGLRTPRLYSFEHARHLVQKARKAAGLPAHVTFAACRHGGMTELGDAGLTESQVMALSAHQTPAAARIYVKRTQLQRIAAARKRRSFIERSA
jgi:hypothetical protein